MSLPVVAVSIKYR